MGFSRNVFWIFYSLVKRKLEGKDKKLVYCNPTLVENNYCRCSCDFCLPVNFFRNATVYLFPVLNEAYSNLRGRGAVGSKL